MFHDKLVQVKDGNIINRFIQKGKGKREQGNNMRHVPV
jgi:hypothetical protein